MLLPAVFVAVFVAAVVDVFIVATVFVAADVLVDTDGFIAAAVFSTAAVSAAFAAVDAVVVEYIFNWCLSS